MAKRNCDLQRLTFICQAAGGRPSQAKARMAELRKGGVAGASSEVVGGDQHAPSAAGVVAEGVAALPRPRPEKIALPRYGEMEKRFDPFTRERLA